MRQTRTLGLGWFRRLLTPCPPYSIQCNGNANAMNHALPWHTHTASTCFYYRSQAYILCRINTPLNERLFLRQSLLSLQWIVHDARHITCKGSSNSNFAHIVIQDREFMFFSSSFLSVNWIPLRRVWVCGGDPYDPASQFTRDPYRHTTHHTPRI